VRTTTTNVGAEVQSLTLAIPTEVVQDDLLVAFVTNQFGTSDTILAPSGWSAIPNTDVIIEATSSHLHGFYRVATAQESPNQLFEISGPDVGDMTGTLIDVSGADSTTPIDASAGQANAASASCTAPSITTTIPGTLLLYAVAVERGTGAVSSVPFSPPPGMTELHAIESTGMYRTGEETASGSWIDAGPTGERAATASITSGNAAVLVAIRSSAR
jgi:hypothetical protein